MSHQGYGQGQQGRQGGQGDPWAASRQGPRQWQAPRPPQPPYQPYGAPPQGYQPQHAPQPPRRRKPHRGLRILAWGSVAFLGLIVLVVALSPKNAAPPGTPASAPAASQQAQASPAATKAAAPRTVATFTGSGIKNTAKFTVGATWKLSYTYDCSSFGGAGNFIVSEDGGSDFTGASVNELGAGGSSSTMAYDDAGTHYLSVNSECDWTVKVTDEG